MRGRAKNAEKERRRVGQVMEEESLFKNR